MVFVALTPNRFGLRLNSGHGVEHRHCAVENAQTTLDFGRKIDVTGRIDNIDGAVIVMPRSCSCSIQSMTAVPS